MHTIKSYILLFAIFFVFVVNAFGQNKDKPNILIIITDQQTWDAAGYSGNKMIKTPNLDKLASEGVNFSHAVTACPVRVPFLIRYPGKIKPGQTISNPVSILNIYPTVLDYAGLKSIPSDGYSLKGLMEGTEAPKYDFAVSEWQWKNSSVPSIMIRTDRWKLMTTHRKGGKSVEALFDLINDPYEMNNLLGNNPDRFKYKETAENLRSKLVSYLKDVNYPLVEGIEQRILVRD